jgi:hypothetical protein
MDFAMFGMLIGGIGGAIKNNTAPSVNDACSEFNKSQAAFAKTKSEWDSILVTGIINLESAKILNDQLVTQKNTYKNATRIVHEVFRQQEKITMIIIGTFIFSIIISFLLRYFNVYSNVWNLIVNNK